jgi:hypothetical protein
VCELDDDEMRLSKLSMYPSSNHMNHTFFYKNYVQDRFWKLCNLTEVGMVRHHTFHNLQSGSPYRFRVR